MTTSHISLISAILGNQSLTSFPPHCSQIIVVITLSSPHTVAIYARQKFAALSFPRSIAKSMQTLNQCNYKGIVHRVSVIIYFFWKQICNNKSPIDSNNGFE